MKQTSYTHRLIARITVEAASPLAIGTGTKDIITDSPVITDVNGMPFIPGTSIAGILRHAIKSGNDPQSVFGYQDRKKGRGSEIIFSDAVMIGADGKPLDGIIDKETLQDEFYEYFSEMPIRQHVKINDKGVNAKTGKFDNQVVYKGTRFLFEVEMYYNGTDKERSEQFYKAIDQLFNSAIRIGSGTRNGYGELKIIECKKAELDLTNPDHLRRYLAKSSNLSCELEGMTEHTPKVSADEWQTYTLTLKPEGFFLFGSGFDDADADMTPVGELVIEWDKEGKPHFSEEPQTLVPASSVKGALAHRTAYYWNKRNNHFAGSPEAKVGENNPAVAAIFGTTKDSECTKKITRGNILISDVFKKPAKTKVVNHVAIDRFTGGAIDGALFTEKVNYDTDEYILKIEVNKKAFESEDESIEKAFEDALDDICKGMLPLGGGVNRGNGIFTGKRN